MWERPCVRFHPPTRALFTRTCLWSLLSECCLTKVAESTRIQKLDSASIGNRCRGLDIWLFWAKKRLSYCFKKSVKCIILAMIFPLSHQLLWSSKYQLVPLFRFWNKLQIKLFQSKLCFQSRWKRVFYLLTKIAICAKKLLATSCFVIAISWNSSNPI